MIDTNSNEPVVEGELLSSTSQAKAKERKKLSKIFLLTAILALLATFFTGGGKSDVVKRDNPDQVSVTLPIKTFSEMVNDIKSSLGVDKRLEDLKTQAQRDENPLFSRQEIVSQESAVTKVVDSSSDSVVSIVVKQVGFDPFSGPTSSEEGIGTGFIVDKTGLIVTNAHVVSDTESEYSVVLKDGTTYEVIDIDLDESSDLAIIEVAGKDLPTLQLGDSGKLKVGQTAIAIGNALGKFSNTVTVGVVSGVARELTASGAFGEVKNYENVIQTDAALNPGNSGGPLLNSAGQVIGINVATTRGADNIGFAIPVNVLKPILTGFLKEGRIIRPYFGVSYTIVSKEIAALRGFPEGAYVSRVFESTPAEEAGIKRGDIITKFDGVQVTSDNSLSSLIRQKKVGDSITVEINRDGEVFTVNSVLKETPETAN
jgi:S1-C subfamily serine protease